MVWVWRHFCLELPDEWAMLQFSRNMQKGRCAFADRYRYRFEFDWRVIPGVPDFDRMLSDLRSRLQAEHEGYAGVSLRVGEWQGLAGLETGRWVSRFGRYFHAAQCLVETIFIAPSAKPADDEESVLRRIRHEAPARGRAHWRAFGMDIHVADTLTLEACRVHAADVELTFAGKHSKRIRFARRGMVSQWLTKPVEDWLRGQLPGSMVQVTRTHKQQADTHAVTHLSGAAKSERALSTLQPRLAIDASAWLCPADGRLYSVVQDSRLASRGHSGSLGTLSCCPRIHTEGKVS